MSREGFIYRAVRDRLRAARTTSETPGAQGRAPELRRRIPPRDEGASAAALGLPAGLGLAAALGALGAAAGVSGPPTRRPGAAPVKADFTLTFDTAPAGLGTWTGTGSAAGGVWESIGGAGTPAALYPYSPPGVCGTATLSATLANDEGEAGVFFHGRFIGGAFTGYTLTANINTNTITLRSWLAGVETVEAAEPTLLAIGGTLTASVVAENVTISSSADGLITGASLSLDRGRIGLVALAANEQIDTFSGTGLLAP